MTTSSPDGLRVGLAQIAPAWLDRAASLHKVEDWIGRAAAAGCQLVVFGEALVPGYPFWVERTDGARFDDALQKELYALYLDQAVDPSAGHLAGVTAAARAGGLTVVLGSIEAAADRGGHSLYCSLVRVGPDGVLAPIHRKLVPTHEERLVWAPGDGHGLTVQPCGPFTLGALNCWENWMPLARAALSAQGEDLHVALWPGSERNTRGITPFLAREGRSVVLSVSGLLGRDDVPVDLPGRELLLANDAPVFADGGSCAAGPDGHWLVEPVTGREELIVLDLDHRAVRRERQLFDPAGHYARPDVLELVLDRRRQAVLRERDGDDGPPR